MRVLVLRFSSLGDVALCLPALKSVLAQNPSLEITFVTRKAFAPLFQDLARTQIEFLQPDSEHKGLPGLYRLFKELKSKYAFEAVIDLHNVLRTQVLRNLFRLSGLRVAFYQKDRKSRELLTRKDNKKRLVVNHSVNEYLEVFGKVGLTAEFIEGPCLGEQFARSEEALGFAPMASNRQKSWPLRHARELLESLEKLNHKVWLFGGPNEVKELEKLGDGLQNVEVLAGNKKGLLGDIENMRKLKLMISMDSANMHLAALSGVPTVSIWGATHPDAGFAPLGKHHEIVQKSIDELPCRPCSVFGQKTCHRGDWACLEQLSHSEVLKAIDKLLA